jgi:hypothetical protein
MKKLLTLGLCLIFASAYSQKINFGLSLGAGKTVMKRYSYGDWYKGHTAFRAGGYTEIKVASFLFVRGEVGYESFSNRLANNFTNAGSSYNVERVGSIDAPVLFKLRTGEKIHPYFAIGAGPSFIVSAKNYNNPEIQIPNSTTGSLKVNTIDNYNTLYWSLYSMVGFDLGNKKIVPFFEVRHKYSLSKPLPGYGTGTVNNITANLGLRF